MKVAVDTVTEPNSSLFIQCTVKPNLLTLGWRQVQSLLQGNKQGSRRQTAYPLKLSVCMSDFLKRGKVKRLGLILWHFCDIFYFLNWSIVDLQYCVSFMYTTKWFGVIYISIDTFFCFIIVYYKVLNIDLCGVQYPCLFYIWQCASVNPYSNSPYLC